MSNRKLHDVFFKLKAVECMRREDTKETEMGMDSKETEMGMDSKVIREWCKQIKVLISLIAKKKGTSSRR